jgi:hypothetical protein
MGTSIIGVDPSTSYWEYDKPAPNEFCIPCKTLTIKIGQLLHDNNPIIPSALRHVKSPIRIVSDSINSAYGPAVTTAQCHRPMADGSIPHFSLVPACLIVAVPTTARAMASVFTDLDTITCPFWLCVTASVHHRLNRDCVFFFQSQARASRLCDRV